MQSEKSLRERSIALAPTAEARHASDIRYCAPLRSRSAPYREAMRLAEMFARDRTATLLIEGEAGTGKTQLARQLHEMSPRRNAPYLECDLGAVDDTLASDDLFGHVAGAFTGATKPRDGRVVSARGGTLFLDEIGKASLQVQQKLLRVIEYHVVVPLGSDRPIVVDVRVIAATNVPLAELVARERFLADLFDRLKFFRITLPPLRERSADIPLLVGECLARRAPDCGYDAIPSVDPELLRALQCAEWPENLRGLDSALHRLLLEARGAPVLTLEMCTRDLASLTGFKSAKKAPLRIEQARSAVAASGGKVAPAARLLGVSRWTVNRVLKRAEEICEEPGGHEKV